MSAELFGIKNSNRDFNKKDSWGKNQFNSSFPAALVSYMGQQKISPVYIILDKDLQVKHEKISVKDFFGIDPLSQDVFYAFETIYRPYVELVAEGLPRIDLVICKFENGKFEKCLKGIEIKLTALPDNQTCEEREGNYGCEIVVRPDTIVYLALSIATAYADKKKELFEFLKPACSQVKNWQDAKEIKSLLPLFCEAIDLALVSNLKDQSPLLMQPVWKTKGKSLALENHCLDVFVWSDFAFTRLFVDVSRDIGNRSRLTRHNRTVVWLIKMLYEFAQGKKIHHERIIDSLTYDTKNDKAFATGGYGTHPYMASKELTKPRITKKEIKNIILGEGAELLSPERRFDAAIYSAIDLF